LLDNRQILKSIKLVPCKNNVDGNIVDLLHSLCRQRDEGREGRKVGERMGRKRREEKLSEGRGREGAYPEFGAVFMPVVLMLAFTWSLVTLELHLG
jgi:hypothetical protein